MCVWCVYMSMCAVSMVCGVFVYLCVCIVYCGVCVFMCMYVWYMCIYVYVVCVFMFVVWCVCVFVCVWCVCENTLLPFQFISIPCKINDDRRHRPGNRGIHTQ